MSFILILGIGITLSWVISSSGERVSEVTDDFVNVQIPRLNQIKALRAALTEHERLLYEYYATTDKAVLWPNILRASQQIHDNLAIVSQAFEGQIMDLPIYYDRIMNIRNALDANLGGNRINWDLAREQLQQLTAEGQLAESILSELAQKIEHHANDAANKTKQQIERMVNLVIGFSILVIGIAAFVGYYTNLNLRESAHRKELALFPERNPNTVINLTWQGKIKFCNPAGDKLLAEIGLKEGEYYQLLPSDFLKKLHVWKKEQLTQVDFILTIANHTLHYNVSLFRDLESLHLYIEDITEKHKAQNQLEFQAFHDSVTNLANRRKFELTLDLNITQTQPFSLIYASIDRFKLITSSHGYDIGDSILKNMGELIHHFVQNLPQKARLFHVDRSQFCIVGYDFNSEDANEYCNKLRALLDEPLCVGEHRYYLTLSFGICHFPNDGADADTLIRNAHSALNRAKRIGDHCEIYDHSLHQDEQSWLPIEAKLRTALEKKEFMLHYQAKVDTQTCKVLGAESLIRWQLDDKMISPAQFIPVAEQTGLIIKIGDWVLEEACRQTRYYETENMPIKIAINLSARQFQYRHFLPRLKEIIEETKVNPQLVELEITESLIMENADKSISMMHKLKDLGFSLAIDDFGTGYSSLSYLKKFPIDSLKIDQAFIRLIETDEDDRNIVRAIIDLAKHLNLKTIAEGVETEGQWHFLQDLHCDIIQGYYFSKPNHHSVLTDMIQDTSAHHGH